MDNQFTLSNMQDANSAQSTVIDSIVIQQNGVQNQQESAERQQVKKHSNVFDQDNLVLSTQISNQPNMERISTQVVEEEDFNQNRQPNDNKIFDKFDGVPDVIGLDTAAIEKLNCIKLIQDKNKEEKRNLTDQIYESNGNLEVQVGSSRKINNHIVLSDDFKTISSNHAMFYWSEDKESWFLNDQKSKHGSYIVINNSPIKEKDKIAIGLFICTTETIKLDLTSNYFKLTFTCMVDTTIDPFVIEKQLPISEKLMIGKSHQPQLKEDPMITNNQCYIQYCKKKHKIKIWNCEEAEYRIAKVIQPGKSVKLKDGDKIRFGLINYYTFSSSLKRREEREECFICQKHVKNVYILNPCNHSGICLECVLQLEQKPICPICQIHFKDYFVKI